MENAMDPPDFEQTLEAHATINILLFQVSPLEDKVFEKYCTMLRSLGTTIFLENVTPFEDAKQKKVFSHLSWMHGLIHIHWMPIEDWRDTKQPLWSAMHLYRQAFAVRKKKWEEKEILGVQAIGLTQAMSGKALAKGYDAFRDALEKDCPECLVHRCLAVEPKEDQEDDVSQVIVIPNQDMKHLKFYLRYLFGGCAPKIGNHSTLVHDFMAELIHAIQVKVSEAEEKVDVVKTSWKVEHPADEVNKLGRRRKGRLAKQAGDFALLCGSHGDALILYKDAMEQANDQHDHLWHGAAMEGYAAALARSMQGASAGEQGALARDVVGKVCDALSMYAKAGQLDAELEARVKGARFVALFLKSRASSESKAEAKVACEVSGAALVELLYPVVGLAEPLGDLWQITAALYAMDIYALASMHRKAALYAIEVAERCCAMKRWKLAHRLMLRLVSLFKIQPLNRSDIQPSSVRRHIRGAYDPRALYEPQGWPVLQKAILDRLFACAVECQVPVVAARYAAVALRCLTTVGAMEEKEQAVLVQQLIELTQPGVPLDVPEIVGLPHVQEVVPLALPEEQRPIERHTQQESMGVFIYTPFGGKVRGDWKNGWTKVGTSQQKSKQRIQWVQGEIASCNVVLHNPLDVVLPLTALVLQCEGAAAQPILVKHQCLQPRETREFRLECHVLQRGQLWIRGVIIQVLGLRTMHPVNEQGHGIPPLDALCDPPMPMEGVSVDVLGPLPRLHVRAMEMEREIQLDLWEGEHRLVMVVVTNTGSVPVHSIKGTRTVLEQASSQEGGWRTPQGGDGPIEEIIEWPWNRMEEHLPLAPGACMKLGMLIHGRRWCRGAQLVLEYSGACREGIEAESEDEDEVMYCRKTTLSIHTRLQPGIVIKGMRVLPPDALDRLIVVIDVMNMGLSVFEVAWGSKEPVERSLERSARPLRVLVDPGSTRSILVPLMGFPCTLPANVNDKDRGSIQRFVLERIADEIALRWTSDVRTTGTLSFRNVHLGSMSLERLVEPLWQISACMESPAEKSNEGWMVPLGKVVGVTVEVKHAMSMAMDFRLSFASSSAGVGWVGRTRMQKVGLEAGTRWVHRVGVRFALKGRVVLHVDVDKDSSTRQDLVIEVVE